MDDIGLLLGWVLVLMICAWSVWFLTKKLRSMLESRTGTVRTLGLVTEEENPNLYWLEVVGLAVAIVGAVLVATYAVFSLLVGRP